MNEFDKLVTSKAADEVYAKNGFVAIPIKTKPPKPLLKGALTHISIPLEGTQAMSRDINFTSQRWVTLDQLVELPQFRDAFTHPELRHMMFHSQKRLTSKGELNPGNGLDKAVVRRGRKILVDVQAFERWLDDQRDSNQCAV